MLIFNRSVMSNFFKPVIKRSLIIFALGTSAIGNAQEKSSMLEREISIAFAGEKTGVALNKIAEKGGFSFSYNASIIDANKPVSIDAKNKTVREVLNSLFKGKLQYKEKGNYIILTQAPLKLVDDNVRPELIIVSGYVIDEATSQKIPAVTIYEKQTRTSVLSNEYGYFSLKLSRKSDAVNLVVNKHNYNDTLLTVSPKKNQYVNVYIRPLLIGNDSLAEDSLYITEDDLAALLADSEQLINTANVKDTLYQKFQFSVLPYLGTNMKMSGSVRNDFSLNLLGGYSMGTNYFELGGVMNSNRSDLQYGQIAGVLNMVGGNVLGGQIAGVTNIVRGTVTGFQLAGCVNVCDSDVTGLQVAGLVNEDRDTVTGVTIAGIGNSSRTHVDGVQIGGIFNYSQNTTNGVQIAGLYNYSRRVNGAQIGFINVSDSCNGVPIGFFSYVHYGYHKVEFSANEIFYTNLAFRTGTNYFHNIFQAGMRPDNASSKTWHVGYGLGTTARLGNKVNFDFDVTASQVSEGEILNHLSILNNAYLGFEFKIARKFSMAIGGTVNAYWTDLNYNDYPVLFTDFNPDIILHEVVNNRYDVKMWIGGKIALRIL
jgi:hypothetical protein